MAYYYLLSSSVFPSRILSSIPPFLHRPALSYVPTSSCHPPALHCPLSPFPFGVLLGCFCNGLACTDDHCLTYTPVAFLLILSSIHFLSLFNLFFSLAPFYFFCLSLTSYRLRHLGMIFNAHSFHCLVTTTPHLSALEHALPAVQQAN